MDLENMTNAAAIILAARQGHDPSIVDVAESLDGAPVVPMAILPDGEGGLSMESLKEEIDKWRTSPVRRAGTVEVSTLESFIALVNRQSGEQSVIFADDGVAPKLVAVLNFHGAGDDGAPSFCDDRVKYPFPLSDEWKTWTGQSGKPMEQAQFAEWLENHLFDIGEPGSAGAISQKFAAAAGVELAGPQALRGLSKGLSIRVEHRVARTVNLQSGEGRIEYTEEHHDEGGGPLKVPAAFHLLIPVFRGGALYSIPVRLRYRTGSQKISWFFEVHRADLFLLDAVNDALTIVRRGEEETGEPGGCGCGLPVFMGQPPGR